MMQHVDDSVYTLITLCVVSVSVRLIKYDRWQQTYLSTFHLVSILKNPYLMEFLIHTDQVSNVKMILVGGMSWVTVRGTFGNILEQLLTCCMVAGQQENMTYRFSHLLYWLKTVTQLCFGFNMNLPLFCLYCLSFVRQSRAVVLKALNMLCFKISTY